MSRPEVQPGRENLAQSFQIEARQLGEHVRDYVRSQVPLWKLVPSLALESTGKDAQYDTGGSVRGINPDYAVAYRSRAFPLRTSDGRRVYVDLETGEFVQPGELRQIAQVEGRQEVPTGIILTLADENPDSLVAEILINKLLDEMEKDDVTPVEVEQYRASVRVETGLPRPDKEEIKRTLAIFKSH